MTWPYVNVNLVLLPILFAVIMIFMDEAEIIGLTREAIWMILQIGMPIMLIGLFVGLIVALFQALTQIQEMTLAFVPKIIAIFASIYLMLPSFSIKMSEYMEFLADTIIAGSIK